MEGWNCNVMTVAVVLSSVQAFYHHRKAPYLADFGEWVVVVNKPGRLRLGNKLSPEIVKTAVT